MNVTTYRLSNCGSPAEPGAHFCCRIRHLASNPAAELALPSHEKRLAERSVGEGFRKPPRYDAAFRGRGLALVEQPPPTGLSHGDGPSVAATLNASVYAVWRVLRKEGIYLRRLRTWCVSTDPEFAPKAAEIVGLSGRCS